MRILTERSEIASTINFRKMPTIVIDLADSDSYGLKSKPVLIDNGHFRDGEPDYIRSYVRAYEDERKFEFKYDGAFLASEYSYYDHLEMIEYSQAPIVKTDQDVILVIMDSRIKMIWSYVVMHTRKFIHQHCITPLTFEDSDNDADMYLCMVGMPKREVVRD